MKEADFRRQLDALGRKYQNHIGRMNNETSPGLKKEHQDGARSVLDEITALEKKREVAKAYAYIKLRANDIMIVEDPEYTETIETWSGKSYTISTGIEMPKILIWIDYHDRLSKEWAAGELALIDNLYPDPPEKAAHCSLRSRCSPLVVGATVLCTSITFVLVMLVWLAKILIGF